MAAPNPDKPRDDGKVRMPSVDAGMNRVNPKELKPARGARGDKALRVTEEKRKDEKKQEILTRARKRFDRCVSVESDNRKNAVDDFKFKAGEGQWPANVVADRNFDQRPTITVNKLPTFVNQVVNDQRMNRPAININPVGDKSDPEVAKMYRGLIRAIERDSGADIAYDTAFDCAVSCGFGYWRVITDWDAPESFNLVLAIKRIRNPFTVYLDPAHIEPDGADAKYGFVTENIPRKEFEEEFPDADPMPWSQAGTGEDYKNWVNEHEIRVAEYFEITTEKRRLVELENGHQGWWDELDDENKNEEIVVNERWSEIPSIKWYKLTATDILFERDWPGKWIPIVKVIGNEIDIEGKVRLSGLIRNAKSPQLLYNYHRTLSVELSSLQPKAPWIMEEGQVEGHEEKWKVANTKPLPYLLYKGTNLQGKNVPPPQRQAFSGAPAAVLQEVQAAAQDMMAVTGIRWDATMQERTYDESGRALRELRERGDLGSFHYVDNLARSLRHCGEILVDLIPKVYDSPRMLTILREDASEEQVKIDPDSPNPSMKGKHPSSQKVMKIFNPTYGRYGVTVTIGPSYATKRIEAAESIMNFVRALGPAAPHLVPLVADLVAKNQDWPESEQIAKRLASQLPPEMLAQDMDDVPPQIQALIAGMQKKLQEVGMEKAQLTQLLTERQSDRAILQDKNEKDFEVRLLGIIAGFEAKMAAIEQKQEQSLMDRVGAPIEELAKSVEQMRNSLGQPRMAAE